MKTRDFSYDLPAHLIAQHPLKDRTASRLMVVNRQNQTATPKQFTDLIDHLHAGDVLVFNDSAVLPARLMGVKMTTGAVIELLLLNEQAPNQWECLVKKARKIDVGDEIIFGEHTLKATCLQVKDDGIRVFKLSYEGLFLEVLDRLGEMPLPPYIKTRLDDKTRYQTVYAKHPGSAAAPTAGLHFTHEYLEKIKAKGVIIAYVTMHIGLGTFRPVSVVDVKAHKMHEEWYALNQENAKIIWRAKEEGRRVIAVGTTAMRTLETIAKEHGEVKPQSGQSDLFIYPGFKFRVIDALFTNFHLPESTLMMLVSAFASRELIFASYRKAIDLSFRFFSFGDAMFIE